MAARKYLVRDWMTPDPITVDPQTTLPAAHKLMKESHVRRLPVVDKGHLVGIVTLGDLREASPTDATSLSIFELNYLLSHLTIEQIMTRDPYTLSPDTTIEAAARLMLEHKIGGLPVVDAGRLVGIITESDIFRMLVREEERYPEFV
jgi:CBS domain-containing protein